MRGLILAIQFLTRLPTPQLTHFDPAWLAESAKWFAVVGLMIGGILAVTTVAASYVDPVFAALVGVV
ncbi:MAG: adenosylcobinamide-GDP ribazoletransferase, partial [Aquaspirillum sp.]|nr:adenosylcobinamide-GDP ribazoletransferase [Aquaspirillum sp.]